MAVDLAREVELGEVSSLIWMGFLISGVCAVRVQEERGEAHPPPRQEQQPGLHTPIVHATWFDRFGL
jgi:hypothetical protein